MIVGLAAVLGPSPRAGAQSGPAPSPAPVLPADLPPAPSPGEAFLTSWGVWAALALTLAGLALLYRARVLGRRSLAHRRVPDPVDTRFWLVAAVAAYAAAMVGAAGAAIALQGAAPQSTRAQAVMALASFATALPVSITLAALCHRAAPQAGLRPRPRALLLGLLALVPTLPLLYFSSGVFQVVYELATATRVDDPIAHPALRSITTDPADPWAWVLIIVAVVLAPVHEELVYRGLLQSALLRATRRFWPSILLTAALFALAHVSTGVPWYAIGTLMVFGACLGFAFERSRNIGVPIAMHMGFNALNVVVAVVIS